MTAAAKKQDEAFEALCARAWAAGCKSGLLNHISPWNEHHGSETDQRGVVWQVHMPALKAETKEKFRQLVREILRGQP